MSYLEGISVYIDPGHGGTYSEGVERCGSYNVGTSGTMKKSDEGIFQHQIF